MSLIYIIYNADSTALGKLKYACTKIMSSSSDASCSACQLTHNGLHLNESVQWSAAKKRIRGAEVKQLHRDELSLEVSTVTTKKKRARTNDSALVEAIHRIREAEASHCAWATI